MPEINGQWQVGQNMAMIYFKMGLQAVNAYNPINIIGQREGAHEGIRKVFLRVRSLEENAACIYQTGKRPMRALQSIRGVRAGEDSTPQEIHHT